MKLVSQKPLQFLFGVSGVIISLAIGYYLTAIMPQARERERMSEVTEEYFSCLEKADADADKQVAEYCKQSNDMYKDCVKDGYSALCSLHEVVYSPNCRIGSRQLDFTNQQYKAAQDNCHDKYPEVERRKERYFVTVEGKIITERLIQE
jgi:hypothetical protein